MSAAVIAGAGEAASRQWPEGPEGPEGPESPESQDGPESPLLGRFDLISPAPSVGVGKAFFVRDRFPPSSVGTGWRTLLSFMDRGAADQTETVLFKAACQARTSLDHPNIIKTIETGEIDGVPYSICQWPAQYETLHDLISRRGWLDIQGSPGSEILSQILDALAYAHGQGVLHLALNSEAILLEPNGNVVLAGFGLHAGDANGDSLRALIRYARPEYLSPEQLRGEPVSVQSDLYSLAIVIYEMLTDRIPSIKPDGSRKWGAYPALPPNLLVPELSEVVSNTLLALLADEPADRCISLDELRCLLGSVHTAPLAGQLEFPGSIAVQASECVESLGRSNIGGADAVASATPTHDISTGPSGHPEADWPERNWQADILGLEDLVCHSSTEYGAADAEDIALILGRETYEPPMITQVNATVTSVEGVRTAPRDEGPRDARQEPDFPDAHIGEDLPDAYVDKDLPSPPREDLPGRIRSEGSSCSDDGSYALLVAPVTGSQAAPNPIGLVVEGRESAAAFRDPQRYPLQRQAPPNNKDVGYGVIRRKSHLSRKAVILCGVVLLGAVACVMLTLSSRALSSRATEAPSANAAPPVNAAPAAGAPGPQVLTPDPGAQSPSDASRQSGAQQSPPGVTSASTNHSYGWNRHNWTYRSHGSTSSWTGRRNAYRRRWRDQPLLPSEPAISRSRWRN